MDKISKQWLKLRQTFGKRPLQLLGYILSLVVALVVLLATYDNDQDLEAIESVFCNGQAQIFTNEQRQNCQGLLGQLLRAPTIEQKIRIREIVGERR